MLAFVKTSAIRLAILIGVCLLGLSAGPTGAQSEDVLPQLQADFLKVIERARQMYAAGDTDLQKGAARPTRAKALCALLSGRRVERWVGTVERLTTNSAGRGVISIDAGQKTHLMTYSNALSDYGDDTMLDPDGRLFSVAMSLKKGDKITFSGSFLPGERDCIREVSLTMAGSIREPWFIFRFAHINKQ